MTSLRLLLIAFAIGVAPLPARAQNFFEAHPHIVPNPLNPIVAHAFAAFELSADRTKLYYSMEFTGLDLEPDPAKRIDVNDIIGIHLHLIVPDVIGPHILNIFGTPSEDDADLMVNYNTERLRGVYDISDASRDPVTGELYPQFFPLTTKVIDDWVDEILNNQTYIAIHTAGENGGALMHGDVIQLPEPDCFALAAAALLRLAASRGARPYLL